MSAQIVQKRRIVKEDTHGPQSQSEPSRRTDESRIPLSRGHPINNTTTTITPATKTLRLLALLLTARDQQGHLRR